MVRYKSIRTGTATTCYVRSQRILWVWARMQTEFANYPYRQVKAELSDTIKTGKIREIGEINDAKARRACVEATKIRDLCLERIFL